MPNIPTHTNYKWIRRKVNNNTSYSNPEHAKLYNSKRWRSLRSKYIRYNPVCVQCRDNNIIKDANVVDHIKPVSEGGSFINWSNLQSLCTSCHAKKTAKEVNDRRINKNKTSN